METYLAVAVRTIIALPTGGRFYDAFADYTKPDTIAFHPMEDRPDVIQLSGEFIVQPRPDIQTVIYLSQTDIYPDPNRNTLHNHAIAIQTGPVVNFHYAYGDTTHSLTMNDQRFGKLMIGPMLQLAQRLMPSNIHPQHSLK